MPEPSRITHRPLWTVLALLAVAAAALWGSSRLTWTWSRVATPLRGMVVNSQDGGQVATALVPLAVLALAALAALFAIGGWLRRLLGILVALAGITAGWLGVSDLPAALATQPTGYPTSSVVAGHGLAILAGLLMVLAGILIVRAADQLPRLGASYQAPSAARQRARDPDAELWQALSAGEDPTESDSDR